MAMHVDATRIPELQQVVSSALAEARVAGASAADADASVQQGLTVTVRMGEVDTIEHHRDRGMAVTVYFGFRKGSASTADLRPEAVSETVAKACTIARYTASDDCAGLADAGAMAQVFPDLDLDHPWDIDAERAVELARECEAAGLAVDARLTNSEGASLATHRGVRVYGNTHGFLAGQPATSHSLSCAPWRKSGTEMQRDYWYPWRATTPIAGWTRASGAVPPSAARAPGRAAARHAPRARTVLPQMASGLYVHFFGGIRGASQ